MPAPSLLLVGGYLMVLVVLVWVLWLLWRWGHVLFYALDYAYIKMRVWWFVRQRHTVVDMFEVNHPSHLLPPSSNPRTLPCPSHSPLPSPLRPLPLTVSCPSIP